MKIVYNCFAGISGDMNLAAMIDLGMSESLLREELSKLGLDDEFSLHITKAERSGINGTQVKVELHNQPSNNDTDKSQLEHKHSHGHKHNHVHANVDSHKHSHAKSHEHAPTDNHEQSHADSHKHNHTDNHEHGHSHEHDNSHKHSHADGHKHNHKSESEHGHHHHGRNLVDISKIIRDSTLDNSIKELSIEIFNEVAKAESKVHSKPINEVHFHEVGATDSIVDIVGAAICYFHMKIEEVISTPPELGGGFVKCDHGLIPVPAPATVEILRGIPSTTGRTDKEMTTPTGAAILKVLTDRFSSNPNLNIDRVAYGIGHRVTVIPNVVRLYSINDEPIQTSEKQEEVIECNIDDMSAERLSHLMEELIKAGAKDVSTAPIIMKKGRPSHTITVLTSSEKIKEVVNTLFNESSTIGYKQYTVNKIELPREIVPLETPWGWVRLKIAQLPSGKKREKLEFEDIKKIALEMGLPIDEVYKMAESFAANEDNIIAGRDTRYRYELEMSN